MKKHIISFKSIKHQSETFDFELDDAFWQAHPSDDISKGDVKAVIDVSKRTESIFELQISLHGDVVVLCDRCLDPLKIRIDDTHEMVVKYGPEYRDDGDDILIVSEREGAADMSQILYEFVELALPITRKHKLADCNPEMLAYLAKGDETEAVDEADNAFADPRWNALKDLKNED